MKRLLSYGLIAAFLFVLGIAIHDVFFADDEGGVAGMLFSSMTSQHRDGQHYDGIDVSHHQGRIDWNVVATDTMLQFVYVKATEGSTLVDSHYQANVRGAHRVGLLVGSYHFLTSYSLIVDQFMNFNEHVDMSGQDLLPMVDVEWQGVSGWTAAQLQDSLALFCWLVKDAFGTDPIIYADARFFRERLAPRFNDFPLFIAHYHRQQPVVKSAGHHVLWQRSEHGHIKGIEKDVDLDVFTAGCSIADILF